MKTPKALEPLIDDGLIDEVIRPLMSGKEASVYVVRTHDEVRCVKVYKESQNRSFQHRSQYQEGRKVRNSRRARAMKRRSDYGRRELEQDWQNAEVEALYQLSGAGIRVPTPYYFSEGVLLMELITDAMGNPAPRLSEVTLTPEVARRYHRMLIGDVVKMLCAGLVHGDLSEYNILIDAQGPVIIDLPQAINAAGNNNARKILARDTDNLKLYFSRYAPELQRSHYSEEIWELYEKGKLHPDTELTGRKRSSGKKININKVMQEMNDANEEASPSFGRKIVEIKRPATSQRKRRRSPRKSPNGRRNPPA